MSARTLQKLYQTAAPGTGDGDDVDDGDVSDDATMAMVAAGQ